VKLVHPTPLGHQFIGVYDSERSSNQCNMQPKRKLAQIINIKWYSILLAVY
jgi:hypothetical protein